MRCTECQAYVLPGEAFCGRCGAAVTAQRETQFCSSCGSSNSAEADYCASCHAPLGRGRRLWARAVVATRRTLDTTVGWISTGEWRRSSWACAVLSAVLALALGLVGMVLVRTAFIGGVKGFATLATEANMQGAPDSSEVSQALASGVSQASMSAGVAATLADAFVPRSDVLLLTALGSRLDASGSLDFSMGEQGAQVESGAATSSQPISGLILVPALALFAAGFASVRLRRSPREQAAPQGAMVAVPFALMMGMIAYVNRGDLTIPLPVGSLLGSTPLGPILGDVTANIDIHWGFGLLSTLVPALVVGAVFGALGGIRASGGGRLGPIVSAWAHERRVPYWPQISATLSGLGATLLVLLVLYTLVCVILIGWLGYLAMSAGGFMAFIRTIPLLLIVMVQLAPIVVTTLLLLLFGAPIAQSVQFPGLDWVTASLPPEMAGFSSTSLIDAGIVTRGLGLLALIVPLAIAIMIGRSAVRRAEASGQAATPRMRGVMVAVPMAAAFALLAYFSSQGTTTDMRFFVFSFGYSVFIGVPPFAAAVTGAVWGLAGGFLGTLGAGAAQPPTVGAVPPRSQPPVSAVTCAACGASVSADSRFCEACGSPLGDVKGDAR